MIEPILPQDARELSSLEKSIFKCEGWSEQMILNSFSSGNFKGFKIVKEKIIAYGAISYSPFDAELCFIAVEKNFRNKGYAKKILQACVDFCKEKKLENLYLEVRSSNEKAISLYQKFGFKNIGVRKKYYPDGEDCINMVLSLTDN